MSQAYKKVTTTTTTAPELINLPTQHSRQDTFFAASLEKSEPVTQDDFREKLPAVGTSNQCVKGNSKLD